MADSQENRSSEEKKRSTVYNLRPPKPKIAKIEDEPKPPPVPKSIAKRKANKRPTTSTKGWRIMVPEGRPRVASYAPQNPPNGEIFCSICLDTTTDLRNRQLYCGHKFHSKCIGDWLRLKYSCPVCRVSADEISERYLNRFREFAENLNHWLLQRATRNPVFRR
ncbi:hypothetical protein AVEN_275047-1 [Araneus ventricosus]|uniref:RING-type domain-containing protein n=1 Tax=Araneus ventricosus TaxID=182803 RepID=A0A4Y2ESP8_ARAVE|nr:hypothetical protein AVEN_275047-1 [Araneus ventricosus]